MKYSGAVELSVYISIGWTSREVSQIMIFMDRILVMIGLLEPVTFVPDSLQTSRIVWYVIIVPKLMYRIIFT